MLCLAESQALGDELADHDREVRHSANDNGKSKILGILGGDSSEQRGEPARERMATDGGRGCPNESDADLNGGQEALGVLAQRENRACTSSPFVGKLLQPGPPERNDGDLGAGEERVCEDQSQNDYELE